MKCLAIAAVAVLAAASASAQGTTGAAGTNADAPATTTTAGTLTPNAGTPTAGAPAPATPDTAAASGDNNQAVATTSADGAAPAKGANSFTQGQAQGRIAKHGFSDVAALAKDPDGIWRGTAMKDGKQVQVWLDYKGSVGQN